MRLGILIGLFFACAIGAYLLWGSHLERALADDRAIEGLRSLGAAGAGAIIGLLVADVLLPIPTTPLLTLCGSLYGALLGGLVGATGSIAAGATAFWLCRALGDRGATWILGDRDLGRLRRWFDRHGGMAVALSRWLPMLPEMVAALAGLARMPWPTFATALVVGSVPMAFAFAALGAGLSTRPLLATLVAAIAPAIAWPFVRRAIGR